MKTGPVITSLRPALTQKPASGRIATIAKKAAPVAFKTAKATALAVSLAVLGSMAVKGCQDMVSVVSEQAQRFENNLRANLTNPYL